MASDDDVRQALLDAIAKKLQAGQTPSGILALAEAYAWVVVPNQGHGGSINVTA